MTGSEVTTTQKHVPTEGQGTVAAGNAVQPNEMQKAQAPTATESGSGEAPLEAEDGGAAVSALSATGTDVASVTAIADTVDQEGTAAAVSDLPDREADTAQAEGVSEEALTALRTENESLQRELAALRAAQAERERIERDRAEFSELYPGVDPTQLPRKVVEQTALPLCAAYALYLRRVARSEELAQRANAQNAQKSSGAIRGAGAGEEDFSLSQIRSMSASQVRRHYSGILRSLKKQNKS